MENLSFSRVRPWADSQILAQDETDQIPSRPPGTPERDFPKLTTEYACQLLGLPYKPAPDSSETE